MQANQDSINAVVVAQSAIALSVAIVVTDAIRECILAARPDSAAGLAMLRLAVAIVLIIIVIVILGRASMKPQSVVEIAPSHSYMTSERLH